MSHNEKRIVILNILIGAGKNLEKCEHVTKSIYTHPNELRILLKRKKIEKVKKEIHKVESKESEEVVLELS